jgi:hypothetical protein
MFGDWGWNSSRSDVQQRRLNSWLAAIEGARLVVIECGAGTEIPTVRVNCQDIAHRHGGKLIRINIREHEVPPGHISLPMGALSALVALDEIGGEGFRLRSEDDERR